MAYKDEFSLQETNPIVEVRIGSPEELAQL